MDEDVAAVVAGEKAEALLSVEPLDLASRQGTDSLVRPRYALVLPAIAVQSAYRGSPHVSTEGNSRE